MSGPAYSEAKAREMAKVVLTKTLRVKAGESVTVETWDSTLPWANAFVLEVRRLGASPLLLVNDEPTYWKSLEIAGPKPLGAVGRHEWGMLERTDAYVNFWGPSDSVREARLPEETRTQLEAYESRWFDTANRVGLRMVRMYLGRVSDASARVYNIDAEAWRRELVDATLVDPVPMHRSALKIAERLRKGNTLEIRHPNGTELRLKLRHRDPRIDSGILPVRRGGRAGRGRAGSMRPSHEPGLLDVALPAGVVAVAVDEETAEGRIVSNEPSDAFDIQLTGGRWEFRAGRLTEWSYDTGGEYFGRRLREAGTNLVRPGMIAVGLNPKISRAPLMRDQSLGMITFGIGGNRFWGGQTEGHGLFHYLGVSEAELRIDGRVVVSPVS